MSRPTTTDEDVIELISYPPPKKLVMPNKVIYTPDKENLDTWNGIGRLNIIRLLKEGKISINHELPFSDHWFEDDEEDCAFTG